MSSAPPWVGGERERDLGGDRLSDGPVWVASGALRMDRKLCYLQLQGRLGPRLLQAGCWAGAAPVSCSVSVWHRGPALGEMPQPEVQEETGAGWAGFQSCGWGHWWGLGCLIAGVQKGEGIFSPRAMLAAAVFGLSVALAGQVAVGLVGGHLMEQHPLGHFRLGKSSGVAVEGPFGLVGVAFRQAPPSLGDGQGQT